LKFRGYERCKKTIQIIQEFDGVSKDLAIVEIKGTLTQIGLEYLV
jgi:hypothetical protein